MEVTPLSSSAQGQRLVRGRFAPSPTGPLHFGSLIAALGSFLEARKCRGEWLLRIEDVDVTRTVPGAADSILRVLERCGLYWDGPVRYQSQQTEGYQAAIERLLHAGLVYPCTCSRRALAGASRARDGSLIYPGTCRSKTPPANRLSALRLQVHNTSIGFYDALQGDFSQRLASEVGDFIIRRADGLFAYQLAVVVDDAAQGVNQIVRGSDLIDSTPRQIYLQRLLNLSTPDYAHLPIVLDSHGEKLSKQTKAAPLDERQPGRAMWAALRFLGQEPPLDLAQESPAIILDWAIKQWRLERTPAIRSDHCDFFACSATSSV